VDLVALEAVQAELEQLHERCERGLILQSEISGLLLSVDSRARASIPPETDLFRLYDSRMKDGADFWHRTVNGYVARSSCKNIGRRIAVIRQLLAEVEPEFLRAEARTPPQFYFQAGEGYRARQEFYRIIRRATRQVDIADPYQDAVVFDFVEPLDLGINIRLLTGPPKSLFLKQLRALQADGRAIDARSNDQNHDRFALLDGSEVWHLGTSINSLGTKAFMMNRVSAPDEMKRVIADFETWWISGAAL